MVPTTPAVARPDAAEPNDDPDPLIDPSEAAAEFARLGWGVLADGNRLSLIVGRDSDLTAVLVPAGDGGVADDVLDELGLLYASRHLFGAVDGSSGHLFRHDRRLSCDGARAFRVVRGRRGRLLTVPSYEPAFATRRGPVFLTDGSVPVPPTPATGAWDEFAYADGDEIGAASLPDDAVRALRRIAR